MQRTAAQNAHSDLQLSVRLGVSAAHWVNNPTRRTEDACQIGVLFWPTWPKAIGFRGPGRNGRTLSSLHRCSKNLSSRPANRTYRCAALSPKCWNAMRPREGWGGWFQLPQGSADACPSCPRPTVLPHLPQRQRKPFRIRLRVTTLERRSFADRRGMGHPLCVGNGRRRVAQSGVALFVFL